MDTHSALSVLGCVGVLTVTLLFLATEVSAEKQNTTENPWFWVDLPDCVVTGDLALVPGQTSKSWRHDGWTSFGKKASADECRQACAADKDCWAFTWYGSDDGWLGYCYARSPNTIRVIPKVFKHTNSGDVSAYKSFAGKSFPNKFTYGYDLQFSWQPETTFERLSDVNLFAAGFSSPTTKDQSVVKGELTVGDYAAASHFAYPAMARGGAVNIGRTFTESMCSAAADYMIYLDLIGATENIVGLYYTWFSSADDWAYLCIIGSQPYGSSDRHATSSGKRQGTPPDVSVQPEYPE